MLDCVTEIPLSGRIFAPPTAASNGSAARGPLPAFVAGPENRLVASAINGLMHATSATPTNRTTHVAPSTIVLFGHSGVGKTHLALGLVRHWQAQLGEASAAYTTAADFRHLWNDAIKRQGELAFRAEYRGRNLLAIDDLQHLPADEHVLQELRYTLDDYEDRGATVIVTSTEPMGSLPNLPPDIRSRLAGGLALQLASPGDAARGRLVRDAARALGRPISDEVADQLAHGLEGAANNIFSAVFELLAPTNAKQTSDAQLADQLLAARTARKPALREIMAVVARNQNVPQTQLKSSSRRQSIVFARGLVVFMAREMADASYEEIGRALGGRDHTTIIHNYRKIATLRERDPQTQQTLEQLRHLLLSR